MRVLKVTAEEAEEILLADKTIDRGGRTVFDLSPEEEKQAKKFVNTGTRKMPAEPVKKAKPEDTEKSEIIADLARFLTEKGLFSVEITNKTRQISFKCSENAYDLNLVRKRKTKTA